MCSTFITQCKSPQDRAQCKNTAIERLASKPASTVLICLSVSHEAVILCVGDIELTQRDARAICISDAQ